MKECVLCKTRYQKGSGVTFHKFPTDNRRLELWLKNIDKPSWRPKKYDYICSKHFSDDCFIKHNSCTTLKKCSIPTFFCSSADTMIEDAIKSEAVKEMHLECRACLQMFNSDSKFYYIFQAWAPPWEGIDNTIAETLEKLTQIQVSDMDQHSKVICEVCCEKLHSAYLFMMLVQQSDHVLWQRYDSTSAEPRNANNNRILDTRWPKPIQVDKIVPVKAEFEIKKDVLTDEETDYLAEKVTQTQMAEMDIKIEPEQILPQLHSKVLNDQRCQSTSCNPQQNIVSKKVRSLSEVCDNIKHDHRYENTPKSYTKELQRVKKSLRQSRVRVKVLAQHVKRLKVSVSSLRIVISELKKKKIVGDNCADKLNSMNKKGR